MIVGRSPECHELLRLRGAAARGHGAARVLTGAAGVGKTTLLRWAADRAASARVVLVEAVEADRHHAFSLLCLIVASLTGDVGLVAPEHAAVLHAALDGTNAADPFAVGAALAVLLASAAAGGQLTLAVDDAQHADDQSRDALIAAVGHLGDARVLVLLAERDGRPDGFARRLPTLDVAGLSPLDVALLLAGDVETRVAEELGNRTEGNPLALLDVATRLSPEQRRGDAPLGPVLPIGEPVRERFLAPTRALAPGARRALLLASTDPGLDRSTLLRVGRTWGFDAADVEQIDAAGLVRFDGSGALRFAHPVLREAVYEGADPTERCAAHRLLAAEIRDPAELARRARHLAAATDGPDESAAALLATAAAHCADGIAAGESWHHAAELSTEPTSRFERLLEAGSSFARGGDQRRAVATFDEALSLVAPPDTDRRADVAVRRAMPVVESLGTRGVRAELDGLVAELGPSDPRSRVLVAISGAVAMLRGEFVEARDVLSSEAASPTGPTQTMLAVARLLTGEIAEIGDDVASDALAAHRGDRMRDDEYFVFALTWGGQHSAASRLVDLLVHERRAAGAEAELAFALTARAYLYFRTGHWSAARADAAEAVELATAVRRPTVLARALFVLARIEAGMGETASAVEHARRSFELGERYDLASFSWHAAAAMGFALLGDGRPAEAVGWLERSHDFARERDVCLLTTSLSAPDLVEAYLRCGRRDDAARLVAELTSEKPDRQGALADALLLRCHALLGSAGSSDAFAAALLRHAEVQAPFEEARTRLCLGEHLRRDREAGAEESLLAAAETFARLGATDWERRARIEVAACTRRRAATSTASGSAMLTPQEYRVAVAVAQGATSRETGARLFLSPRTVEYHLAKIYRKLGLRSRSDLVRHVAADPHFAADVDAGR